MTDQDDFYLRHTGYMDGKHARQFIKTGELQMPLFDTSNPEVTWKTTDSWADDIVNLDEMRASHGESE